MSNIIYDFSGKTAVITGASKGIGRDLALAFAKAGCDIGITGRNEKELAEVAGLAREGGVRCEYLKADLADAAQCLKTSAFFCDKYPVIDILINNAGLSFPETIVDLDVEHWNTTLNVNLRAPVLMTKIIVQGMIKRRNGNIVNISSNACLAGIEEHAAYCASKFGLNGITKVMAVEFGPHNIRVNCVAPTVVLTPMGTQVWGDPKKADPVKSKIPLGRFAQPEEITEAVMFLASDACGMIHGETLVIDGGVNAKLY